MKELILLKSGEVGLKGLNRSTFEQILMKNVRHALEGFSQFKFYKAQSVLYAEPIGECDLDEAMARLSRVFGFSALTRAAIVPKDFNDIKDMVCEYLFDTLSSAKTFKVKAKRSDKTFPVNSTSICTELGDHLLDKFPNLTVDVHSPQVTVTVEVRDFAAYIHTDQIPGACGLPIGSSGRGMLLLSGGIDSPVAGMMMSKRGVKIAAVHFASPPYTSERSLLKVKTLCKKMTNWCGRIELSVVEFTEIQQAIHDNCPEELSIVIMRRQMMLIAEQIAKLKECGALVTGESLGQVASQTMAAMACTEQVVSIPILRPLVALNKEEIILLAHKIDTFATSILPYEDCCTVFTPKHPKTNPKLAELELAEKAVDFASLREKALNNLQTQLIGKYTSFEEYVL